MSDNYDKAGPLTAHTEDERCFLLHSNNLVEVPVTLESLETPANSSWEVSLEPPHDSSFSLRQFSNKSAVCSEYAGSMVSLCDHIKGLDPNLAKPATKGEAQHLAKFENISKSPYFEEKSPLPIRRCSIENINNGLSSCDDNSSIYSFDSVSRFERDNLATVTEDEVSDETIAMAPSLSVLMDRFIPPSTTSGEMALIERTDHSESKIQVDMPDTETSFLIHPCSPDCDSSIAGSTKTGNCYPNNSPATMYNRVTAGMSSMTPYAPVDANVIIHTSEAISSKQFASAPIPSLNQNYNDENKHQDICFPETSSITTIEIGKSCETAEVVSIKKRDIGDSQILPKVSLINRLTNYVETKRQSSAMFRYAGTGCVELLILGLLAGLLLSKTKTFFIYIVLLQYGLLAFRIVYISCHTCNFKIDKERKVKCRSLRSKVEAVSNTIIIVLLSVLIFSASPLFLDLGKLLAAGSCGLFIIIKLVFTYFRLRERCSCYLSSRHRILGSIITHVIVISFYASHIIWFELVSSNTIAVTGQDAGFLGSLILLTSISLYVNWSINLQYIYNRLRHSLLNSMSAHKLPDSRLTKALPVLLGMGYFIYFLSILIKKGTCIIYSQGLERGFDLGNSFHTSFQDVMLNSFFGNITSVSTSTEYKYELLKAAAKLYC